jgi:hypothetical protein
LTSSGITAREPQKNPVLVFSITLMQKRVCPPVWIIGYKKTIGRVGVERVERWRGWGLERGREGGREGERERNRSLGLGLRV